MPIVTDHPSAVGSLDAWGLGAGASKVAAVASNDGDTSYIFDTVNGGNERFTFPSLPSDAGPVVNSCTWSAYLRAASGSPAGLIFDGNLNQTVANPLPATYTLYTINHYSTLRDTINAGEGGVAATGSPIEARCTELYRTTDYVQLAGGFAFLLTSIVGPLLGAAVQFGEMPVIAAAMRRTSHGCRRIELRPDELRAAWEELRAWRRPAFCFLFPQDRSGRATWRALLRIPGGSPESVQARSRPTATGRPRRRILPGRSRGSRHL